MGVILFNGAIGVLQQWYAKKLVEKFSLLSGSRAEVLRDGASCQIPVDELVKAMGRVTKFTGYFILPVGILLFVQAYWFRADPVFLRGRYRALC